MDEQDVVMKARAFIAEVGPSALPVLVDAYARHIGGVVSSEALDEREDAWSVQLGPGRYRICVNCAHNARRQRFSVCHEVAHVVLGIPAEHAAPSWSYARRSQGEVACDVFAAELLLPYKLFKPRVDASDIGFGSIGELADEFEASMVSTASRYATFSRALCAFVLTERGRSDTAPARRPFALQGHGFVPARRSPVTRSAQGRGRGRPRAARKRLNRINGLRIGTGMGLSTKTRFTSTNGTRP